MTVRRTRSGLLVAVSGAVLVVTLAACSSGGGSSASGAASSGAPAASSSPTTVAAAFDRVASATSGSKSVKGTLTTTTPTGTLTGQFAYKFTPAGVLSAFTFDQGGKTFTGILTPEAIYLGGSHVPLPGGKKYLKVPLDGNSPLGKTYAGLAKNFTSAGDLQGSVAQWKSIGNLHAAGTETVGGVTATKYVGTFDPSAPPAGASAVVKQAYSAAAALGVSSVTTTIWVGPDGLPLKVESVSTGGKVPSTTVITYSDWGAPVAVAVPGAGEVTDLSTLLTPAQ